MTTTRWLILLAGCLSVALLVPAAWLPAPVEVDRYCSMTGLENWGRLGRLPEPPPCPGR